MTSYISLSIVFLGVGISIILIFQNIKLKKSLIGSFFKRSYNLATLGSIFLLLSFFVEFLEEIGFLGAIAGPIHHIFLLISSLAFFSVAVVFPKETEKILSDKK